MTPIDVIGVCSLVSGAVWTIAQKISDLHKVLDRRLDKIEKDLVIDAAEMQVLGSRLDAIERRQEEWFPRLDKEIHKCTIPPQD